MGTRGIRVGTRGIRVGMRRMGVAILGSSSSSSSNLYL